MLRAKLFALQEEERLEKIATTRKMQVGTGSRSEKIRTYNFPQNRITDHRAGITLHKLDSVLEGDLKELLDGVRSVMLAKMED